MAFVTPGKTLGIIGGGSETYLLEIEAKRMGFRTVLLTKDENDIATTGADFFLIGELENINNLDEIGQRSDILLYMDEDFDSVILSQLEKKYNVAQGSYLLSIVQDRYIERTFLNKLNVNVPPFFAVASKDDVQKAVSMIGFPCILKPIRKYQSKLKNVILYREQDLSQVDNLLKSGTYILEAWISTKEEFSIMISKSIDGKVHTFPMIKDIYDGKTLMSSLLYQKNDPSLEAEIQSVAIQIAENIDYVGIFGIGFIISDNDVLYVKRIYPGINYSANVYNEATGVSQFEIHLRAICDWPIPEIYPRVDAATLKIIEGTLAQSLELLETKQQWKFNYYTGFKEMNLDNRDVGFISVVADNSEDLDSDISSTKIWRVD
ncbi:ATP-grasp domain-containing protein [Lactobacillus terrae]|uniref:ATP-grasp domain-containing protein n=1 Tax=Lactobacillus terrae TaxID=2269374 RepID=UPI000C1B76AA|nr:ATP-grasp domain-containing protein [Lactobacillus terrae]